MKFLVNEVQTSSNEIKVGNVYAVWTEQLAALNYVFVVIAITPYKQDQHNPANNASKLCCLEIGKDGDVRGVTVYDCSHFRRQTPIGFVEGIENITFSMRQQEGVR
jgi:hypothetical protein